MFFSYRVSDSQRVGAESPGTQTPPLPLLNQPLSLSQRKQHYSVLLASCRSLRMAFSLIPGAVASLGYTPCPIQGGGFVLQSRLISDRWSKCFSGGPGASACRTWPGHKTDSDNSPSCLLLLNAPCRISDSFCLICHLPSIPGKTSLV